MPLADDLPIDHLTPALLWSALDAGTRRLAAEALYDPVSDDEGGRIQADRTIAAALRFREASVRRLPVAKRAEYLARVVRPSDPLSSALLTALHVGRRSALLAAFLDALGIPQTQGVIDPEFHLEAQTAERLGPAAAALRGRFPDEEIELYLASLLALDPSTWGGLADPLRAARGRRRA